MLDDGLCGKTASDQADLEAKIRRSYSEFPSFTSEEKRRALTLLRDVHVRYLSKNLGPLPSGYLSLDASRTWLVFWIVHSLALLDAPLPPKPSRTAIIEFLDRCQHPTGGFGGGPHQLPHLASTYAAVASLVTLGGSDALGIVRRKDMFEFLKRMCVDPSKGGGLTVHDGGEVDVRGCYTAMATAHLLGLDKAEIAERCGMVAFIKRCQSHEGGLGGEPGNEAHGGYAFCGVGALALLGKVDVLDLPKLLHWLVNMQGPMEGGFKGRCNKLVDGCYSYWQGATFPIIHSTLSKQNSGLPCENLSLTDEDLPDVPELPPLGCDGPVVQARVHEKKKLQALSMELGLDMDDLESEGADGDELEEGSKSDKMATFHEALGSSQRKIGATEASVSGVLLDAIADAPPHYPLVSSIPDAEPEDPSVNGSVLYDALALQFWLLKSCQARGGGLRDKPGKPPDLYHTCYCLSGLSIAQHYSGKVLGPPENTLVKPDPVLNIVETRLKEAEAFFSNQEMV
ncbi:hypothetical protein BSKO_11133 [Bryopsis sp. KO-2023]|nr:hypothetical protein BSKO_11133 [Bryopsis sp. KO-2023]